METSSKKTKVIKGLKIGFNVVFYLLIFIIFLVSIANIRAGKSVDGFPNIFGRGYLIVESDSMNGNYKDSFKQGDMVVVNQIGEKDRESEFQKLKVGQIITFYDKTNLAGMQKQLNTHRVVYLYDANSDGTTDIVLTMGDYEAKARGYDYASDTNSYAKYFESLSDLEQKQLITKIDGNAAQSKQEGVQVVSASDLRGTYRKTIGGFGSFMATVNKYGIFIIVLPLTIFLAVEVFFFVKNLKEYKNARYAETHQDEIKAQEEEKINKLKEELRKEVMAELEKEKQASDEVENKKEEDK